MRKAFPVCLVALTLLATCLLAAPAALAAPADAAQAKEVEALVNAAIKLIQEKGEAAWAELNAPGGPWSKGSTSIFVSSKQGVELVNPGQPQYVGKNLWDLKDANGRLPVQEEWKLVKAKGQGWLDTLWVKPGTDRPARCRTFVKGVEVKGKPYMVGAAYYLD